MLCRIVAFIALASVGAAQQINFQGGTGTRSLWIPYKTISGVPLASILGRDDNNHTTYVLHCPTAQPDCAIAPKLTLTEGVDLVRYTSSTSGAAVGTFVIDCTLTASPLADPVTCDQNAHRSDVVAQSQVTIPASEVVYQAVDVTATSKAQATGAKTTGKKDGGGDGAQQPQQTGASATSTGGVAEGSGRPFGGVVGVVGAGVVALMAL